MASEERNAFFERQLFQYAIDGKCRKIQKLLGRDDNIPVDITNNKGQTLLYISCLHRRLNVAAILLQFGADPNKRCHDGSTPTHAAAYSSSVDLLKCIVKDFGGDMRLHDKQMRTPRDWAVRAGRSVNGKTLRLIETWQEQVNKKMQSRRKFDQSCTLASLSKSSEMLKSNFKIDCCGYGSFLQSSAKSRGDGYVGIAAVLPLASPSSFATPDNLSLMFKSPPAFIMEEALWCGHKVMIKRSRSKSMSLIQATEDLLISEARASRHLRHPNLLLLMSMCLTSPEDSYTGIPSHWLVYEPTTMGSLYYVLYKSETSISPLEAAKCMIQIADALIYIHMRGFVHCALTSHAVYLMENFHAKLGDTFYLHCDGEIVENALPASSYFNRWVAPEVVLNGIVSTATDVYGLCVVVSEALSGTIPWYGCDNASIENHIKSRRNYFVLPDWLPNTLKNVLEKGLKYYSHNRVVTIKDISICLKSLIESGELKTIVTKVSADKIPEVRSIKDDRIFGQHERMNVTYPKLESSTANRTENNISDESYVTAGIDVPDAGPIYSPSLKQGRIESLSNYIPSELPNFSSISPANTCIKKIATLNPVESELTKRPHSCSILTQDGLLRELLPTAMRHNSHPDVCKTDSQSCTLPPPYKHSMRQGYLDRNTSAEGITIANSSAQNQTSLGQNRYSFMEMPFEEGKGKRTSIPTIQVNQIPTENPCRTLHSGNDRKTSSLPILTSVETGNSKPKSPPSKIYMRQDLKECPAAPLPDMKSSNKALLPDLFNACGIWKRLRRSVTPTADNVEEKQEDFVDAPDCRPGGGLQRTISFPGDKRKRVTPLMRQMVSSSALLKYKSNNNCTYGDFNYEERYNIESEDLEEIFGSFAERKNRKDKESSWLPDIENAVEVSPDKEVQTYFITEQAYPTERTDTKATSAPENLDGPGNPGFSISSLVPETTLPKCYGTNAETQTYNYGTSLTAGEVLMEDLQNSDGGSSSDELPANPNQARPYSSNIKETINSSVNPVEEIYHPFPNNRSLQDHSREIGRSILVCNDIAGGVSVLSPREPVMPNGPESHESCNDIEGKSIGYVTCQEINDEDIDISKGGDVHAVTDSVAEKVIIGEAARSTEKLVNNIDEVDHTGKGESSKVVPSNQLQEVGESGFDQVSLPSTNGEKEIENCQEQDFDGMSSVAQLKGIGLPRHGISGEKAIETPSKWPFQKKLCLFKVVADNGQGSNLSKKVVTKNQYSKVQRVIERFEEQDSHRECFPKTKSYSSESSQAKNLMQEESVDDSRDAAGQDNIGTAFKTSTPVSQHHQPVDDQVKCRDAVNPRSFEEVRSDIEAASNSKYDRFEQSSQNISKLTTFDLPPEQSDFIDHGYGDNQSKNAELDMEKSGFTTSLCTEQSNNTYDQLTINPSDIDEIRKIIRNIIKDITEKALMSVERNLVGGLPRCSAAGEANVPRDGENDADFCLQKNEDEFQRKEELSEIGSETHSSVDCGENCHEIPIRKSVLGPNVARSLPASLDKLERNCGIELCQSRAERLHSCPDLTTTFDCDTDANGQECSSFVSDPDDHRSIDTSIWSM